MGVLDGFPSAVEAEQDVEQYPPRATAKSTCSLSKKRPIISVVEKTNQKAVLFNDLGLG